MRGRLIGATVFITTEAAIHWIGNTYPEQPPKRYSCSIWRHVLNDSRQFEIRKSQADNERTAVWYRSKVS